MKLCDFTNAIFASVWGPEAGESVLGSKLEDLLAIMWPDDFDSKSEIENSFVSDYKPKTPSYSI